MSKTRNRLESSRASLERYVTELQQFLMMPIEGEDKAEVSAHLRATKIARAELGFALAQLTKMEKKLGMDVSDEDLALTEDMVDMSDAQLTDEATKRNNKGKFKEDDETPSLEDFL